MLIFCTNYFIIKAIPFKYSCLKYCYILKVGVNGLDTHGKKFYGKISDNSAKKIAVDNNIVVELYSENSERTKPASTEVEAEKTVAAQAADAVAEAAEGSGTDTGIVTKTRAMLRRSKRAAAKASAQTAGAEGAKHRASVAGIVATLKQKARQLGNTIKNTGFRNKFKKYMKSAFDFSSKQASKTELSKTKQIQKKNVIDSTTSTEQNLYDIVECFVTVAYNSYNLFYSVYTYLFVKLPVKIGKVIRRSLLISRSFFNNLSTPLNEISKIILEFKKKYVWTTENKQNISKGIFAMLGQIFKQLERIVDYILPICAITVFAWVVIYMNGLNYMLKITYDDKVIGYVKNEKDYYTAEQAMKERVLEDDTFKFSTKPPAMELVIAPGQKVTDTDAMTNTLLRTMSSNVVESDGIYIDGIFLGAVKDGQEFLLYIDSILSEYRNDPEYKKVEFEKRVQVKNGLYPASSATDLLELKKHIETNEQHTKTIKTVDGDTLKTLANKNNTTVENIISLNDNIPALLGVSDTDLNENFDKLKISERKLPAGKELAVNTVGLNLGIKVTRLEVYKENIPYKTEYQYDDRYPTTYTEILRVGVRGEQEVTANVVYVDGEKVSEQRLEEKPISEPVTAIVKRGTITPGQYKPSGSSSSVSYLWPVQGGRVTYGLYEYPGHTGMDIAAPYGTPVYASREGTISYASNYSIGAYGKRIDINHGDGTMTRYAHLSSVIVNSGQFVRRGQVIGYIGSTGNSTGNHLHFEVRINGKIMNPADFVGRVYPGKQNLG